MKRHPRLRRFSIATVSLAAWMLGAGLWNAVQAQSVHHLPDSQDFQQVINGIFYPRSSEEFFLEGRDELEGEIRLLQDEPDERGDRPPLLEIDESVYTQQEEWENREQWLRDDADPTRL